MRAARADVLYSIDESRCVVGGVMDAVAWARGEAQLAGSRRFAGVVACALVVVALAFAVLLPAGAAAQEAGDPGKFHSLDVNLEFPDDGLASGEQLCVALYPGRNPDLDGLPLLSRCIDPGQAAVTFEGLPSGEYSVLLPGPGSETSEPRYQGQLVATAIPEDDRLAAYGIDVALGLAPEFAGTTASVRVNVFGCPAGTNAGGDRDGWAAECQALAGGIPLTLSGTGSIEDAAFQAVTGLSGADSGRVEFTDLPPGAYELGSDLPRNVSDTPALFVESSIDGSLGSLDPSETLALRPTETVAVDVFLVIDPHAPENVVGAMAPAITGELGDELAVPDLILD
jgi:hypothetical protein